MGNLRTVTPRSIPLGKEVARPVGLRPELVVDIEDTIVHQKIPTLEKLNKRYGVDVTLDEIRGFFVQEVYNAKHGLAIDRPEIIGIHREIWDEAPRLVDPRIRNVLEKARTRWHISIVTASVADSGILMRFLAEQRIPHDSFERVDSSGDKIVRRPLAYACIDDHDKVVTDFARNGKTGIVLDWPWNRHVDWTGENGKVIRMTSWGEAADILDSLAIQAMRAGR